jgi:hypothetical protein
LKELGDGADQSTTTFRPVAAGITFVNISAVYFVGIY